MFKADVRGSLLSAVNLYAKLYSITPQEAFQRLVDAIETQVAVGDSLDFLGKDWGRAAPRASTRAAPAPIVADPKEESATAQASGVIAPIGTFSPSDDLTAEQIAQLDRSEKLSSGFTGVYANGNGFRARVRAPGGVVKYLTTCRSPERAAWERLLFYREHNMPYGVLGETVEWLRSQRPGASDEELLAEAKEMEELRGGSVPEGAPLPE